MDIRTAEAWPASTGREPLIAFAPLEFEPWRVQPVRHHLARHPLLQMQALVSLAERLDAIGSVRTHSNDATAATPFNDATRLHPNPRSGLETISDIAAARAFLSLLNVQRDPLYRKLVGDVLESVRPVIEARDPGMSFRAGWIFVSSPRTVTPFHFDKEHNFLLQISGRKRVYVWDPQDTVVASEAARDRFHATWDRDLLKWDESFRARAHVFELGPGEGAYMPSTAPHLVENGDEVSITMSFTYYTRATRRDAVVHKLHWLLRRAGLKPPAVGALPMLDDLLFALAKLRWRARRLIGAPGETALGRFAEVDE